MKEITQKELLDKYGIDLPKGKYSINTKENVYDIYSVKDNTEGCILVGECKDVKEGFIYNSKKAMKKLMAILKTATDKNEEIRLSIY